MTRKAFSVNQILARAESCAKKGDLEKASQFYRKVLTAYPRNRTAQKGLKALQDNAGRGIKPVSAKQDLQLLNTYCASGKLDEAAAVAKRLCKTNPDVAMFHNLLGVIQVDQGELVEGIESYRRALKLKPDFADANFNLGNMLRRLNKPDHAVSCYERALAANPAYAKAHNNLGLVLKDLGKMEAARSSLEKALQCEPDYLEAHNNLGLLLSNIGEFALAIESFERALAIKPDHAEVHRNISRLKKYEKGDPQIEQIEELLSNPNTGDSDRIVLCFSLAKAYEDLGDIERSFQMLDEGNHIRKNELNYSFADDELLTAEIKKMFSVIWQHRDQFSWAAPAPIQPIFIVGMPRSGTSLAEQILASHSRVYGAGELSAFDQLMMPIRLMLRADETGPQESDSLTREIADLREGYINVLKALEVSENLIVDKMPLNFRWIGFVFAAFPDAKIIHLQRDPRAVCWSCYKRYFPAGGGFTCDLRDLAGFYNLYLELMSFWREYFPDKIFELDYEKLTENQEAETRRLLAYCELDWEDQCLDFHETQRAVETASSAQVRLPMYRGSSEAWKRFEPYLQPLLSGLNVRDKSEPG